MTKTKPPPTVQSFSNGSQFSDWLDRNCADCWKFSESGKRYNCQIQKALDEAYFGDGKITQEIATRMGHQPLAYSWACPERQEHKPPRKAPAIETTPLFRERDD